jgi:beta-hydroxylase
MNVEMVGAWMEKMIAEWSPGGERTFFDNSTFSWVAPLESEWRAIRTELNAVLVHKEQIPNLQDVSPEQRVLADGDAWKSFFLYGYGHWVEQNCTRCPETARLLRKIPGLAMAFFSILAPKAHIPPHRGPYKGLLRYHLGLMIPQPSSSCRIRVGNEIRSWQEGKSLIFDDSYVHEAWNDSDWHRVVLFVDFVRPLPLPLSLLNRLLIWRISKLPFIAEAVKRVQNQLPHQGL